MPHDMPGATSLGYAPHLSHFEKVCLKDSLAEAVTDFLPTLGRLHRTYSSSRSSRGIT